MPIEPERSRPPRERFSPRSLALLAGIGLAAAALLPRLFFFSQWPANFDADEALLGVHAREIAAGRLSLFLPGQSYMGSLQSLAAAPLVALFGATATAVRLSPLLWIGPGLAVLLTLRASGGTATGRRARWILACLWLFPPAVLFLAGVKARGGYLESIVLGFAALALLMPGRGSAAGRIKGTTARAAPEQAEPPSRPPRAPARRLSALWSATQASLVPHSVAAGLLLGLAVWTHDQALLFLPPAIFLLVARTRAAGARAAAALGSALAFALAALLGYLPLWLPRLVPFGLGPPGTEGSGLQLELSSLLRPAIVLDLSRFTLAALTTHTELGTAPAISVLYAASFAAAALAGVFGWVRAAWPGGARGLARRLWREDPALALALWPAAAACGALLATPELHGDPQWFRYTLAGTPLLVLAAARGLCLLPARASWIAVAALAALGARSAASATAAWEYAQAPLRPALARALVADGKRHVLTDWQLAYALRYLSRDGIVTSSWTPPRFPESNAQASFSPEAWVVRGRPEWKAAPAGSPGVPAPARSAAEPTREAVEAAFAVHPRPDPPPADLARALAACDPGRTLYARFEPFPLLREDEFRRDWRGWPYKRPLERFEAIVWDPRGPCPVPDERVAARLRELRDSGRFRAVFESDAGSVYVRND